MAKKSQKSNSWMKAALQRTSRAHFGYVAAYMGLVIIFDSWNLITHESVAQRWSVAGALLVLNTAVWYVSHMRSLREMTYAWLIISLAAADTVFATLNVYWERGMASNSVILFAVPLLTIAVLRNRLLLIATATVCAAAYSTSIVRYFNDNYGEGYRVELWGNVFFYSALFFVLAWQLYTVTRSGHH